MRLVLVVHRYGVDAGGGAERLCRETAVRLAARGHQVRVLTSCARSYVDWADELPAGEADDDGVVVERLPVVRPRSLDRFAPLQARVVAGRKPVPWYLQAEWMRQQGPRIDALPARLASAAAGADAVVFYTYLYWTTWAGLPAVPPGVPAVLVPTAHDEPPLYLPLFETTFRHASAFGFLTEEEAALVARRFPARPSAVLGAGVDLAAPPVEPEQPGYPYLVYVGRVDPNKGFDELHAYFAAYKERNPGPLRLVVVGDRVGAFDAHPDMVFTGYVDEARKRALLRGALALVHPSYFESFSITLVEAWAQGTPALVQGRCDVLRGQVARSGGGVAYTGFAEFEEAVRMLVSEPDQWRARGVAGRRHAELHYGWDTVIDRYESFLAWVGRR